MGRFTFRLPDIGEGIAEAEIVAWHVAVGDRVEEDGRLADMMTDKATVEMESPVSGTVIEVAGEVGDTVAIGSPLVVIEVAGEGEVAPASKAEAVKERIEAENPDPGDVEKVEAAESAPTSTPKPRSIPNPGRADPVKASSFSSSAVTEGKSGPSTSSGRTDLGTKVLASPAVRARAKELGVDLAQVRPAEGARVRHADLDAFVACNAAAGFRPAGTRGTDEQVKVIGLRRRIAENMAASKRHIPHFSYVEECDVTALEAMRGQLNDTRAVDLRSPSARQAQGDRVRLSLLPLLIAAICRALPEFPMINARYDDEAGIVTRHGAVHLGIAAQTPQGLMVPVIRDAQDRNLWQLAAEIARLAEAARSGSAKPEELSGSTLTLTSLGPLGGIATTPVINRPEVAIIGPNRIVERPMFVPDGQDGRWTGGERIEKRKLMNISISCDHRVVDGHDAASFIQAVKKLIEAPVLLLAD